MFRTILAVLVCITISTTVQAQKKRAIDINRGMIFEAAFDGTEDVNLFAKDGDGWIHTADSLAMKTIKQGNHLKDVEIVKGAGRYGDALHFKAKTKQVLIYKASKNGFHPKDNWSGTVGVWLKLNPDKDLPAGYCDPLQITSKKWNDASFFIDFDKTLPRDFRLGTFPDYKFWNPKDTKFDDIPVKQRPMVVAKKPAFSSARWTHVAFTFQDVNSTKKKTSAATLYVNGKSHGTVNRPMKYTWSKPSDESPGAVIMLGIGYVGYMDNLQLWDRALSPAEIDRLFNFKNGE